MYCAEQMSTARPLPAVLYSQVLSGSRMWLVRVDAMKLAAQGTHQGQEHRLSQKVCENTDLQAIIDEP